MNLPNVGIQVIGVQLSVHHARVKGIILTINQKLKTKIMSGQKEINQNGTTSPTDTKNQSVKGLQENLLNSEEHQNDSNAQWHTPTNARELAIQANKIATLLLNNQVDINTAQKYSALVRGISQLMSIELSKARIEKTKINLDLIDK